jgi:isoleucyl-tRNA synthetase
MFQRVDEARFIAGEHEVLRFWEDQQIFQKLREQNRGKPKWSFLDGPITANNPMGVHHAWGRTYKDAYQRYFAMTGHELRYQNGFDCQGLWVEVEVEKELGLGTKKAIHDYGIDKFVRACKQRVLKFAARQTEQSIRLGYWMEWDLPDELRKLAEAIGEGAGLPGAGLQGDEQSTVSRKQPASKPSSINHKPTPTHTYVNARGQSVTGDPEELTAQLGNPAWGGSYFTFSTENNETIWSFLKKCFDRSKVYRGHDVMPWGGRSGSAYSQMEVADGRKLTTHRSCFVRFPITDKPDWSHTPANQQGPNFGALDNEYLLVWTTTPWTLTSNVAAAVNPDLDYVRLKAKIKGDSEPAYFYFAKDNLDYKRLEKEFKEGFGGDWTWPDGVPKLKTISQLFKEQGGYEIEGPPLKGADMIGWRYAGPFDDLDAQFAPAGTFDPDNSWSSRAQKWRGSAYYDRMRERAGEIIASTATGAAFLHAVFKHLWLVIERAWMSGVFGATSLLPFEHIFQEGDKPEELYFVVSEFAMLFKRLSLSVDQSSWEYLVSRYVNNLVVTENYDDAIGRTAFQRVNEDVISGFDAILNSSGRDAHRVIDGGRDSKGTANVVAGEGTGIVHIAPGCGDIDHKIGVELGLPIIAPLREDGTYGEGFGPFTGREAIAPSTADLVFEELKRKGYLVYVETYPHIYPHCWRTGEELIFRLVDEWFINMDWRDEIKEVTRAIDWKPASIQGQEREVEWLTTMRDWMISKKRFWGLALPIWINPKHPGDIEVIGSLAELKFRATDGGEGWEEFEGHTPHRPWIDRVKLPSRKHPGELLERIQDVGNPWLDAGIVPFSTLNYNERYPTELLKWSDWFPANLVTECFPGQFRNWFYSLLSLATMMRYDETSDPEEKKPFQTLLGHRLVMDEQGNAMHKSDGTAIWFEEAAEQLGVDTLRWLYLAQNPAQDLRFGTRHPQEPVTLQTPDGPIEKTKEGLPTCKVTSTPADEIRRQVLIPLWNSYAFFVNYAVLDGFDPSLPQVALAERPEIDRWILSRLQELTQTSRDAYEAFDAPRAMQASAEFIDDLSNWYIRRNRRRFWRARTSPGVATPGLSERDWDADKLAAYQTLYEVLVTLTKLLAPAIPFLSERMYQNLVVGEGAGSGEQGAGKGATIASAGHKPSSLNLKPDSVHLCPYPEVDPTKLDPDLNWKTHQVQALVTLAHRMRDAANQRVRQPLAELRFACREVKQAKALEQYADVIADELNVKAVTRAANLDDLVSYTYKPNLKTLGPKYGKLLNAIKTQLPTLDPASLAPLRNDQSVTVTIDGQSVTLDPADVMVSTAQATDWACADDAGIQVALSTKLTPELVHEGMARDLIRHVQQLRKDADLEENERIVIEWSAAGEAVAAMLAHWSETIRTETRADGIATLAAEAMSRDVMVGETPLRIAIRRAGI